MAEIITLPKSLCKDDELVIMPRSEYENLLRISKEQQEIDQGLDEALQEVKKGEVSEPFSNSDDLMKSLNAKH